MRLALRVVRRYDALIVRCWSTNSALLCRRDDLLRADSFLTVACRKLSVPRRAFAALSSSAAAKLPDDFAIRNWRLALAAEKMESAAAVVGLRRSQKERVQMPQRISDQKPISRSSDCRWWWSVRHNNCS